VRVPLLLFCFVLFLFVADDPVQSNPPEAAALALSALHLEYVQESDEEVFVDSSQ
jgi:hypothetical protein